MSTRLEDIIKYCDTIEEIKEEPEEEIEKNYNKLIDMIKEIKTEIEIIMFINK